MNAITQQLVRRWNISYLAPVNRRTAQFLDWWSSELIALLPESLRRTLDAASRN